MFYLTYHPAWNQPFYFFVYDSQNPMISAFYRIMMEPNIKNASVFLPRRAWCETPLSIRDRY